MLYHKINLTLSRRFLMVVWCVAFRNELFGYYECEKGIAHAAKVQAESEVVARWNEYMKDVMTMETDPETGAQPKLKQVFSFRANEKEKT